MDSIPHKTVVWITAITYELLPTGEVSGVPLKTTKDLTQITGSSKEECLEKTTKFIEDVKKCQSK